MININPKLEKYIFEVLGGVYSPSYLEAVDNLGNDEERNLRYLGTYFPRTFVEAYCIYDNIFSNRAVYEKFASLARINILIIGSGTGGDLVGLLSVLNTKFSNKQIYIYSFDGNKKALSYQRNIVNAFYSYSENNGNIIKGNTYTRVFDKDRTLVKVFEEELGEEFFHIIQSFKFGNELYNSLVNENVFYDLIYIAEEYLDESGIFVMEDVTIKNWDGKYNPCEMTNQVRKYYRKNRNSDLVYVIPKSCAKWNGLCNCKDCFSQVMFGVQYREADEKSKVTFKVFMMKPLGTEVLSYFGNENCYLISDRTYCTDDNYYYNCDNPPKSPCEFAFKL